MVSRINYIPEAVTEDIRLLATWMVRQGWQHLGCNQGLSSNVINSISRQFSARSNKSCIKSLLLEPELLGS